MKNLEENSILHSIKEDNKVDSLSNGQKQLANNSIVEPNQEAKSKRKKMIFMEID